MISALSKSIIAYRGAISGFHHISLNGFLRVFTGFSENGTKNFLERMLDSYIKSYYKTADKRSTAGEQANN